MFATKYLVKASTIAEQCVGEEAIITNGSEVITNSHSISK